MDSAGEIVRILEQIHKIVWGPWLLGLFLAAGLLYTIRSRGFQLRGFSVWWKATAGSLLKEEEEGKKEGQTKREQIKTACTALAATVGTGNIVGVATAITAGGPGALFWMWVSAAIGMITAYAEVYLGIESRFLSRFGTYLCGPFVYLERMAGRKGLAVLYALLSLFGSLGMGSMVQANSLAETVSYSFSLSRFWTAFGLVVLIALIVQGGRQRIGEAAAALVPFSAGIYLFFSFLVLISCRQYLPEAVLDIFREAFRFRAGAGAAAGWGMGNAVRYGIARGVFSNEAGLGSMAVLHGDSPGKNPSLQGMWAMFEVFFDTVIVCSITGLVILCGIKKAGVYPQCSGAALASWCFSRHLGKAGGYVVSVSLILFAFATIIAWYYLGSQALTYLIEKRKGNRTLETKLYQTAYLWAVCFGCLAPMGSVWLISDILNGLMALPNLTALFLLAPFVRFPQKNTSCRHFFLAAKKEKQSLDKK